MGDKERKKPSSIRTRVDRARRTYGRKSSPVPMILAGVFLVLFLVGLYVALGGKPQRRTGSGGTATTGTAAPAATAAGSPTSAASSARQPKSAFEVAFYAKQIRVKDPDGAIRMIRDGIAKFGETPELYQGLSLAVDEKMVKAAKGSAAYKQLAKEKLGYLEKAMGLINVGKNWEADPIGNKTGNLQMSIEQARKAAGE